MKNVGGVGYLSVVLLLLASFSTALGDVITFDDEGPTGFQLKVDLCFNFGTWEVPVPDDTTWKGSHPGFEDWIPWPAYVDSGAHDARNIWDVGGSGIHIGIASAPYASFQMFLKSYGGEDKICNSWITSSFATGGNPQSNTHLVIWANEGLVSGAYTMYGYHNNPDGSEPNMVKADARAYCADNVRAVYPARTNGTLDNIGKGSEEYGAEAIGDTSQYPCDNVISDVNDYDIPIQHEANDANLVASVVRFITDGNSPVWVMYHSGAGSHSVLNAFIIEVRSIGKQTSGPNPLSDAFDICPDRTLVWQNGLFGIENDVYFGTDFNDVNDANTSDTLGIYIGRQEANEYNPSSILEFGTKYYWRVDAINDDNVESPWKGRIWQFTTETGKAYAPDPADAAFHVDTFPPMSWSASCLATSHDVYLGSSLDDVNNATTSNPLDVFQVNQNDTGPFFPPYLLENVKRYYWRIDEHTPSGVVKGDVWSFFTYGGTLFHYTFDGQFGQEIHDPCDERLLTDDTGNVHFQIFRGQNGDLLTYAESNPIVNPTETSAHFDSGLFQDQIQRVGLYRGEDPTGYDSVSGIDITDLITPEYTIEMWIKLDPFFDAEVGLFRKWDRSYGLTITYEGYIQFWQAGSDPISSDANNPVLLNTWTHVAGVSDSCDTTEPQKLYIDGELGASGGTDALNPDNDDDPVTIGCKVNPLRLGFEWITSAMNGLIDELRVSDLALLPKQFLIRGGPALAWMPKPKDGEMEVVNDRFLKWRPGDYADSHDVFFGTSFDDVNEAETSTALIYKDNHEANEYDPNGFDLDTTYYWRIDEVNDSNGFRWKGTIWSFTVRNYLVIEDFESYNDSDSNIVDFWQNLDSTGSVIDLGTLTNGSVVHGGNQSMQFQYNNTDELGDGNYSEVEYNYSSGQDWTDTGAKIFTIFFYGDPNNDANATEQMYVGLADDVNRFDINYADMNDIHLAEWLEWNILLSDFTDVNLSDINNIYLGFGDAEISGGGKGTVYFDDIRLYSSKCVTEFGPAADISGDCIVDYFDVEIMAYEWLSEDDVLVADLYLDGSVNFRDYAVLMNAWLDEQLWPE